MFRTSDLLMQKNWVVSDFHLRHQGPRGAEHPLWESRGYESYDHMTGRIIDRVNSMVMPNDNLFFLGDWCLNSTWNQFSEDLARFQCQNIYMLWGNHNSRVKDAYYMGIEEQYGIKGTDVEIYPLRWRNLIFLGNYQELVVDGQRYILCHYPIDVFNKGMDGAIMICGHSHGNYDRTRAEYPFSKRLDVSWDCFLRPLLFSEVKEICSQKQIVSVDHHGK